VKHNLDKGTVKSIKTNSRAWDKTLRQDDNGCMVCDNKPNQDGYVRVGSRGHSESQLIMLHILRWELLNGKIPSGMELNHKCSNRKCCNTDHLELIDGSAHATLTNVNRIGFVMNLRSDEEVAQLYWKVKYGGESINNVSKEYGIKRSTLSSIMNKRSRTKVTNKVDEEELKRN